MSRYACIYFPTAGNRHPVEELIDSLDEATQRKYFYKIGLLESFGPLLPEPHAKKVDKREGIYELRFKGSDGQVRVLYFFFDKDQIILTNGFIKKSNKLPKGELEKAIQRRRIYITDVSRQEIRKAVKKKKK